MVAVGVVGVVTGDSIVPVLSRLVFIICLLDTL